MFLCLHLCIATLNLSKTFNRSGPSPDRSGPLWSSILGRSRDPFWHLGACSVFLWPSKHRCFKLCCSSCFVKPLAQHFWYRTLSKNVKCSSPLTNKCLTYCVEHVQVCCSVYTSALPPFYTSALPPLTSPKWVFHHCARAWARAPLVFLFYSFGTQLLCARLPFFLGASPLCATIVVIARFFCEGGRGMWYDPGLCDSYPLGQPRTNPGPFGQPWTNQLFAKNISNT